MRLMTAHKILIGTGCLFFLLFAGIQWTGISSGQGSGLSASLGLAAAVAMALYLRTLKGK